PDRVAPRLLLHSLQVLEGALDLPRGLTGELRHEGRDLALAVAQWCQCLGDRSARERLAALQGELPMIVVGVLGVYEQLHAIDGVFERVLAVEVDVEIGEELLELREHLAAALAQVVELDARAVDIGLLVEGLAEVGLEVLASARELLGELRQW